MTNERFYIVDEVAEILRTTPQTIRQYIREGKLEAVKIGKQYRISNKQLADFIGHSIGGHANEKQDQN